MIICVSIKTVQGFIVLFHCSGYNSKRFYHTMNKSYSLTTDIKKTFSNYEHHINVFIVIILVFTYHKFTFDDRLNFLHQMNTYTCVEELNLLNLFL